MRLKEITQVTVVVLFVSLTMACATPHTPNKSITSVSEVVKSPSDDRAYRAITLANGVDVVLISDPSAKKASAALSIPVGAMWDPMDYQGMAHYLEHLIHLGTTDDPTPDGYSNFLAQNGGSRNAYTSLDETNYFFYVNDDALEPGLAKFAAMFSSALLDPKYASQEKNAVASEWSMRREADGRSVSFISRSLMGDHPANRFVTGNLDTLGDKEGSTLTQATRTFYETYYSSHLMTAAIEGARSLDELEQLAVTYFGALPKRSDVQPKVDTPIDFNRAAGKLIRYRPLDDEQMLRMEFFVDELSEQYRANSARYLSYILGSEMPHSPATVLKKLGWASALGVGFSSNQYGNYGSVSIDISLTEQGLEHREDILALVFSYLEKLRTDGIDDRYIAELQTSLANRFRFAEKMPGSAYVSHLASAMHQYPLKDIVQAPYLFESFNEAEVIETLNQLVPSRAQVWYIDQDQPTDQELEFYAGTYSLEPLALPPAATTPALAHQVGLALPALNTLLPESFELASTNHEPAKIVSSPAIEVWLQGSEKFQTQPKGLTDIYLNSPHIATAKDRVLQSLWLDLILLKSQQLRDEAGIAGMGLQFSGDLGLRMQLSGFSDKQARLFADALDYLDQKVLEEEFLQAKERLRRSLQNAKRSFAYQQLFPVMGTVISGVRFDDDVELGALESVSLSDLQNYITRELNSAYVRVYMYGNYSEADAKQLGRIIEEKLPDLPKGEYVRAPLYAPTAGEILSVQKDIPVEDLGVLMAFIATDTSDKTEALQKIASAYLREQSFNQLRTEEQLGYAVGAGNTKLRNHSALYLYIQTNVKAPAEMVDRFSAFIADSTEAVMVMSDEDFEKWRGSVLTNVAKPPSNLAEEASPFFGDFDLVNLEFDSRDLLIEALQAVTLEEFRAHFDAIFSGAKSSQLVVQLRGNRFAEEPFAALENAKLIEDFEAFHQKMSLQAM